MSWTLAQGVDGDGKSLIVLFDNEFQDTKRRAGRETLLAVQFPGIYMLQSPDHREAFHDSIADFLARNTGVFVAGVTRARSSYTFLHYLGVGAVTPDDVPVPENLRSACHVWVARDPEWVEYESFAPRNASAVQRLRAFTSRLFGKHPGKVLASGDFADRDVLDALEQHGSDMQKSTELVFYLYVPGEEQAEACAVALWEKGFRAHVSGPLGGLPGGNSENRCSVIARLNAVPSEVNVNSASDVLTALAERFGGEYDGWEAAVQR